MWSPQRGHSMAAMLRVFTGCSGPGLLVEHHFRRQRVERRLQLDPRQGQETAHGVSYHFWGNKSMRMASVSDRRETKGRIH